MILSLIESAIRHISGIVGIHLRRSYYQMRLGKCGKKVVISEGVYLDKPGQIELGDYVWIDRNAILIAGRIKNQELLKIPVQFDEIKSGKIIIGANSHIGIGTVLQGHGGIFIAENFTSSAYCKIYSLSNDPKQTHSGTIQREHGMLVPGFLNQVIIARNVWLGLNVSILGGTIGANTFVKPNSVITSDIEENSIVEGAPGIRIKDRFNENKN